MECTVKHILGTPGVTKSISTPGYIDKYGMLAVTYGVSSVRKIVCDFEFSCTHKDLKIKVIPSSAKY